MSDWSELVKKEKVSEIFWLLHCGVHGSSYKTKLRNVSNDAIIDMVFEEFAYPMYCMIWLP
jgi:hypothetical protein